MGAALVVLVAAALATFVGMHVALLVALALRRPRHRALVALVVPPLAAYWSWRAGIRRRVGVWAVALVVYAVGVAVTSR
jgi:hypothetical protein